MRRAASGTEVKLVNWVTSIKTARSCRRVRAVVVYLVNKGSHSELSLINDVMPLLTLDNNTIWFMCYVCVS